MNPSTVWFPDVSIRLHGDEEKARDIMDALGEQRPVEAVEGGRWTVSYTEDLADAETAIRKLELELSVIDGKWRDHLQVDGISKR